MRSQKNLLAQFCVFISLLICWACVHKPDTFSMNIVHNKENVYFQQSVFSKGPGKYKMGHPRWRDNHQTFKFAFELDDISSIYYAYLSIETQNVDRAYHPILLNDKKIGYLKRNISQKPFEGTRFFPSKFETTQMYLPKNVIILLVPPVLMPYAVL